MKAACDPAGGSGGDSMGFAWADSDGNTVTLLGVSEKKPPFSPRATVEEVSKILAGLGLDEVTGDRYAGGVYVEMFAEHGIRYVASELSKSQIYSAFLVLANSGRVRIPFYKRLIAQLRALERRVMKGTGRESIDHPAGAHDDIANAAAMACVLAWEEAGTPKGLMAEWISLVPPEPKVVPGKPMTPEEQAAFQRWEDSFFDGSRSGGTDAVQWGRKRGSFE